VLEVGLVGGIVDQYVDAAETVDSLLYHFAAVLGVLQVGGPKDGLPSFFLDEFFDLVRFFGLIEKGDQDFAPTRANAIATARPCRCRRR
jgi:hypothetical protein